MFGGNWNRTGPSRREVRSGSMAFRKISVACSAFFSRRMCVIRMLAFTAKTNPARVAPTQASRSEEHTSELQSLRHLVCRLLLEKKNKKQTKIIHGSLHRGALALRGPRGQS